MSQLYKTKDNVYLNVVINQDQTQGNNPAPATYKESLTIPILDDCSKYYCSIIRFSIPLNDIPILIMPILNNQPDPNLTPLIFGIRFAGTNFPVNVVYVSLEPTLPPTPAPIGPIFFTSSQLSSTYYWVYTFTNVINMFNTALNTAMTNAGLGAIASPFYSFNPVNQLFSLTITPDFFATGAEIFMNNEASNYLSSFNYKFYGYNQPQGRELSHILTPLPSLTTDGTYIFTEDYNTIVLWFSIRKILITTNDIPIQKESAPRQSLSGMNTGVNSQVPVVADYVPQLEFSNQSRSIAYYTPLGQYKLVDMISEIPLNKVDFGVYWQDKIGNVHPLLISVGQQIELKIAFIKKDMYKNTHNLLTYV